MLLKPPVAAEVGPVRGVSKTPARPLWDEHHLHLLPLLLMRKLGSVPGTRHLLQARLMQGGESGNLALAKFSIGGCRRTSKGEGHGRGSNCSVFLVVSSPLAWHCNDALPEKPVCYFYFFIFPCFLFLSGSGAQVP